MKQRITGKRLLALLLSLTLTMSMTLTSFATSENPEQTGSEQVEVVLYTALEDGRSTSVANVSGGGSYVKGMAVTVSAGEKEGLTFQGWHQDTFDGTLVSADAKYTFNATANTTLVAVYQATANVSLTVTAVDFTVNDKTGTSGVALECPIGETVNLVYTGTEEFLYWKNATGKIVSKNADYTFPIVSATELTAVTTANAEQSAYVEFLSAYGQIMQAAIWDATGTEYALPAGPAKAGCTFQKWSVDGQTTATVDSILQLIKDGETRITLNPVYKESKKSYTVTVNYSGVTHDVDSYTIEEGKSQLITATEVADATFSYWSDAATGGNVLSYNRDYRVYASKDMTLYAVYNQTGVTAAPVIRITNTDAWTNGSKNMLSFEATRGIPSGYTLVEHGMLVSKTVETPNADQEGVIKLVSNDSASNGVYIANVSVGNRILKVYARGYMVVKDNATGEYQTIYSDSVIGNYPYLPQNRFYDVLQDFEGNGVLYNQADSVAFVADHKQSGESAVKLTLSGEWRIVILQLLKDGVRLETADWAEYEYIKMSVYSETDNVPFWLWGKQYTLKAGENVLTITSEDMIAQIASDPRAYDNEGGFFFQMFAGTIYIDSIIGVYPELPDTEETEYFPADREYDVLQDFENGGYGWHASEITANSVEEHAMDGQTSLKLTLPVDWKMIVISLLKDGARLETADWQKYDYIQAYVYSEKAGTQFNFYGKAFVLKRGANKIQITSEEILTEIARASNVYDSEGGFLYEMTAGTIYVDSIIGVYPEGYVDVPDYLPNNSLNYDMLQDFEGSGIRYSDSGLDVEYGMRHHLSGTKAVKLTNNTTNGWKGFTMLLLKSDGTRLEQADWGKYQSIKMYVYSVGANTIYLNSIRQDLQNGANVIEISKDDFYAAVIANGPGCKEYDSEGAFFCQLVNPGTIYIDSVIANSPYE